MKRSLFVVLVALASIYANVSDAHVRGCNSRSCDARTEHAWSVKHPMQTAIASWFDDAGATASGTHYRYGFAHKTLPFGTQVRFCHAGRCVIGKVEDRGPFVAGREFDLNFALKSALACSDLCSVQWRLLH